MPDSQPSSLDLYQNDPKCKNGLSTSIIIYLPNTTSINKCHLHSDAICIKSDFILRLLQHGRTAKPTRLWLKWRELGRQSSAGFYPICAVPWHQQWFGCRAVPVTKMMAPNAKLSESSGKADQPEKIPTKRCWIGMNWKRKNEDASRITILLPHKMRQRIASLTVSFHQVARPACLRIPVSRSLKTSVA